ncbi:rhodanese-like domain-containing protein [Alteromonas halophila]|uniref:Rhodanese-like domain-containing protein n=1 Tax=Alteromonas halophila TaxID=516698 RepID=A0A918N2F1_9ALTE|nr:rhodanese-like domain-containing protein [Alteromonas halophila]GGW97805.1 rhodanese-like domain-containing protein [Alteromonas halophila]
MRYLAVLLLSILALGLLASVQCTASAEPPDSVSASPYLLERVKNNEWLLLDVRSEQEYREGHIPGAINVPHDRIDEYLAELDDYKDKPVIVYCRSGRRAKLAMKQLQAKDFNKVSHLEGDMLGWNATSLPVEKLPKEMM